MQISPDAGVGQRHAPLTLFDRYATHIFRYIYQQVGHRQDAEDLTLDVFLAATDSEAQLALKSEQQQLAWLQRVARNKVIDRYRRQVRTTLQPLEADAEIADDDLTPEQYSERNETYERLFQAVARLPQAQQEIIHLRFVEGLRCTQIAQILDKSDAFVRTTISRALKRLRTYYGHR
ncbi:RNA polymerase sigma factor [Ktedonobacter sp. SOSP1-85]|uniref:RNA polymerase sigma factor n=1 Tax=Ktedonobacter sp. SOSP1-85 TaxID=2778367 RepID=UPI001916C9FD|nr:sigma-70 family RNA polymerase sigma factor [Ktedonobacter sp. SOSP1-85]GHO77437.1 RNA polymerase sigma factor [Ktedonobacter sp. SOSP1-85]